MSEAFRKKNMEFGFLEKNAPDVVVKIDYLVSCSLEVEHIDLRVSGKRHSKDMTGMYRREKWRKKIKQKEENCENHTIENFHVRNRRVRNPAEFFRNGRRDLDVRKTVPTRVRP